jgi:hypothetical protein
MAASPLDKSDQLYELCIVQRDRLAATSDKPATQPCGRTACHRQLLNLSELELPGLRGDVAKREAK